MADAVRSFLIYFNIWLTELSHDFKRLAKFRLKLIFGFGFSVFFMAFVFLGFYRLVNYVKDTPFIGTALVGRIVSMVFLSLFIMLIYSSIITAFSTLFFSKDNRFLIVSPFNWTGILGVKLCKTVFYSSWMSVVILLPFMAVLHIAYSYAYTAYLIIIPSVLMYFIISSSLACLLVLGVVRLFPARKIKDLMVLGIVVIATSMYLLFRFLDLEQILRPDQTELVTSYIRALEMPKTEFLPSHWISRIIIQLINLRQAWLTPFIKLCSLTFLSVAGFLLLAKHAFYSSWEKVQSEEKKRYVCQKFPKMPVIAKDLRTFFRDTRQWTQLILIISLIVIYIVNIYKLPLDLPYIHYIVAFANIGMIGAVIASVGLRFAFSCFSLEGRYFWILLTSPFERKRIFIQKYLENYIPILLLSLILVLVSNIILKAPSFLNYISTITVIVFSITITSLGISMGIIYPKFSASSPAEVESSWGAILYMISSFFYIALTLALEAVWVRMLFIQEIRGVAIYQPAVFVIIIILSIFNLIINYFILKTAIKRLESIEFSV